MQWVTSGASAPEPPQGVFNPSTPPGEQSFTDMLTTCACSVENGISLVYATKANQKRH